MGAAHKKPATYYKIKQTHSCLHIVSIHKIYKPYKTLKNIHIPVIPHADD